jgi:hypothetical protein
MPLVSAFLSERETGRQDDRKELHRSSFPPSRPPVQSLSLSARS